MPISKVTKKIELDAPNVSNAEKESLCDCIDSGFISTYGPFVSEFEEKFSRYIGAEAGASIQSGTAAIHIALHELGIRAGNEVIVPALTFVASVNPIVYVGAKPVFVDVDIKTWNIDPDQIKRAITKNTKAIIPVHLYGNPCNMDEIMNIAQEYGLYVIEDATESLGSKYKGKHTGTFGDLGCFSFNGNKTITTGGGGMVIGNDRERIAHIKFLINQGRDESKGYYHPEIGFNYRMTNLEASLGLAQMKALDYFLAKKEKFNSIYKAGFKDIDSISFQSEYKESDRSFWLSTIIFENSIDITSLQAELKKQGIPTRRIFMPIVEFPPYKQYKQDNYENAYRLYERGLCLPSSTLNSEEDIHCVCNLMKETLKLGGHCEIE